MLNSILEKDCKFTFFFTKITSQLQISIKHNYIQKYALHLGKDLKSTKYYSTKTDIQIQKNSVQKSALFYAFL